jgi:TonB family protein
MVNIRSGPAPTLTAVEQESSVPITAAAPENWNSQPRPSLIENPTWARRPYIEFPEAALANKIGNGRVTLRCTVVPTGALTDCTAIEERPTGQGFAQSALSGAQNARISPRLVDGAAIGASVQFTINYNMPVDDPEILVPSPKR